MRIPVAVGDRAGIAAVAPGIARGALDDIVAIATAKVPMLSASPLAGQPGFQHDLAVATTELLAAQALLREQAGSLWSAAEAGVPATLRQRAEARSAAAWIAARAGAVVDTAHRLGGGGAVYRESPLRRRFADIHTLTQHFIVARRHVHFRRRRLRRPRPWRPRLLKPTPSSVAEPRGAASHR